MNSTNPELKSDNTNETLVSTGVVRVWGSTPVGCSCQSYPWVWDHLLLFAPHARRRQGNGKCDDNERARRESESARAW